MSCVHSTLNKLFPLMDGVQSYLDALMLKLWLFRLYDLKELNIILFKLGDTKNEIIIDENGSNVYIETTIFNDNDFSETYITKVNRDNGRNIEIVQNPDKNINPKLRLYNIYNTVNKKKHGSSITINHMFTNYVVSKTTNKKTGEIKTHEYYMPYIVSTEANYNNDNVKSFRCIIMRYENTGKPNDLNNTYGWICSTYNVNDASTQIFNIDSYKFQIHTFYDENDQSIVNATCTMNEDQNSAMSKFTYGMINLTNKTAMRFSPQHKMIEENNNIYDYEILDNNKCVLYITDVFTNDSPIVDVYNVILCYKRLIENFQIKL